MEDILWIGRVRPVGHQLRELARLGITDERIAFVDAGNDTAILAALNQEWTAIRASGVHSKSSTSEAIALHPSAKLEPVMVERAGSRPGLEFRRFRVQHGGVALVTDTELCDHFTAKEAA